ncbi:hypothetical protein LIER_31591 [Lithospermum erythrorhizon]|uniref:Uncharacterized protein n=1 Tax=Lithospermum erythrorhizon TaxID=34254 RepID=A0AAV3RRJ0_LITER
MEYVVVESSINGEMDYEDFRRKLLLNKDKPAIVVVESSMNGEMDYGDFRRKLLLNKDKPAIVVANIGTTFKGAIDNLDLIIEILQESAHYLASRSLALNMHQRFLSRNL